MDDQGRSAFVVPMQGLAIFGVYLGASSLGQHGSVGGAWGIDMSELFGVVFSVAGMLTLEATFLASRRWQTKVALAAAVAGLGASAWNLFTWPPIEDGAYFLWRYDRDPLYDGYFPAEAHRHAQSFAVVAWAVYLAAAPSCGDESRWWSRLHVFPRLVMGALLVFGMVQAFTAFANTEEVALRVGLAFGSLLVGALAGIASRKSQLALLVSCVALASAGLMAAFRAVETLPFSG